MAIAVVPIVVPKIDWEIFTKVTYNALERSVTASLDRRKITVGSLASYVSALGEFQQTNSDALQVLRDACSLLKHIFASFLVRCPKETLYRIAIEGSLSIIESDESEVAIISATMDRWHISVIEFCSNKATKDQRIFGSLLLREFDIMGLSPLWDNYSRKTESRDSTVLLTEKR